MSLPASTSSAASHRPNTPDTRLHGRWLLLTRGSWISVVVLTLVICFASLPMYVALLQTPCAGSACVWLQPTPGQAGALTGIGLSLAVYAAIIVALTLATLVVCLVVSALIIWRRPDDRMALFVALWLVMLGPTIAVTAVIAVPSPWQVPYECLTFLSSALSVLVFFLFPSGQFVPRWTRWILVVSLALQARFDFFPVAPLLPNNPISQPGFLVALCELATVVLVQLHRYRRVSSPRERQQTKWVVFGIAVPITVFVLLSVLSLLFPVLAESTSLYPLAHNMFSTCWPLFFPLSFGVAILRSRLWDIDTIINKALVYGLLTGLLGALYAGLIIGLESLAGLFGGTAAQNPVVLVISTLAIAALFLPVRRRIQAIIDWRFYRRKYDAEKTLAAFSATLRQETDLEKIREQLIAGVQETMQPAHVSLWLRPLERQRPAMPHRMEPDWPGSTQPSDSAGVAHLEG